MALFWPYLLASVPDASAPAGAAGLRNCSVLEP
eukprot:CAMPEP_0198496118 /NCGR_PEP_ID=MMETSP1462-20131121/5629_1 /TAXON_ID=1333877 /ORGANISM="Brandtodinium nutriculum, Strain RCC3387" /LENGTH=32 /DNA_ID= /DNA_START= /DNA_END= /DNA_ORIENTATION=